MIAGTKTPIVSIVIPCRDHAAALDRCLTSLRQQRLHGAFEIVVVDSSSDESALSLARSHAQVRFHRSKAKLLPGPARNLGAKLAKGRYLTFIDADCVAEPDWLAAALASLERDIKIVGGVVLQGVPWHPIAAIDNLMQFVDLHPMRAAGPARLLASCNLALRKSDFEAMGGFPEPEQPAGEDVMFFAKARSRWPQQLYFEPTMQVRHFGRTRWREFWSHQVLFGFCRALYALELKPRHRYWGQFAVFAPAVAAKRLSYLVSRAAGHLPSLGYVVVLFPILLVGVSAWCIGFHRGCRRQRVDHGSALDTSNQQPGRSV